MNRQETFVEAPEEREIDNKILVTPEMIANVKGELTFSHFPWVEVFVSVILQGILAFTIYETVRDRSQNWAVIVLCATILATFFFVFTGKKFKVKFDQFEVSTTTQKVFVTKHKR